MGALPPVAVRLPRSLFGKMTEVHFAAQGEFRKLNYWRYGYEAYLTRLGWFSPNVEMMFERFEIVEDFG